MNEFFESEFVLPTCESSIPNLGEQNEILKSKKMVYGIFRNPLRGITLYMTEYDPLSARVRGLCVTRLSFEWKTFDINEFFQAGSIQIDNCDLPKTFEELAEDELANTMTYQQVHEVFDGKIQYYGKKVAIQVDTKFFLPTVNDMKMIDIFSTGKKLEVDGLIYDLYTSGSIQDQKKIEILSRQYELRIMEKTDKELSKQQKIELAKVGDDNDLDVLVMDPSWEVRRAVAQRKREKDLDVLVNDPEKFVREVVLQVSKNKNHLAKLLCDEDRSIRQAALNKKEFLLLQTNDL